MYEADCRSSPKHVFDINEIITEGFERWVGKVAVVTNAASGIGTSIAQELAYQGLLVVGLADAIHIENVEKVLDPIAEPKGKLYPVICDIFDKEDVCRAFHWVNEHIGPIHILVNSAGIYKQISVNDGDTTKWLTVLDVNMHGLLNCSQEAIKMMKKYRIYGHIINFKSLNENDDELFNQLDSCEDLEFNPSVLKIKVTTITRESASKRLTPYNFILYSEPASYKSFHTPKITKAIMSALSTKPYVQVKEIKVSLNYDNNYLDS